MKLTPDEMAKLPNPFMPVQALAIAALSRDSRKVVVMRADGGMDFCDDDMAWVKFQPGDEIEIIPRATTGGPANAAIES